MTAPIRTHSALARGLAEYGSEVLFGVLGDGNLAIVDELVNDHGVRYVPVNREDVAVVAADAYTRVSGKLGLATVTHGPGLTNAITSLHEAARSRTPLVVICGDTDPADEVHNQNIDQRASVAPTGAGFVQLRSAQTVGEDLATVIDRALKEGLPIVFNLPADLQASEAPFVTSPSNHVDQPAAFSDQHNLDRALGIIASARRPFVLAGRGALGDGARIQLLRLAELLRAPVATTLKAKGFFSDETFDLGVCGILASSVASDVFADADCAIVFGAGLNRYTTSYGSLFDGKAVVQVDSDPTAIGRWQPVDAGVVGDSSTVAAVMADSLESHDEKPPGLISTALGTRIANWDPSSEFDDLSTDEQIDPRTLMIWLDKTLPKDRGVVCDVGGFMEIPLRYLGVSDPLAHVLPAAFGSVGLGMGASIGAGVANPDRPILAVLGDGGWMMGGIYGFDTVVREGIDLICVVLNDGGYGIERRALESKGSDSLIASMPWPNPADVATALGGESVVVKSLADLENLERRIAHREGPLLIDARVPR